MLGTDKRMELHQWKREHRKSMKVNPIIFDFLDEHPGIFEYLHNIEWTNIGIALNMLPKNREIKQEAFKLYCHTLMNMDCFQKRPAISKGLIIFLRAVLSIIPAEKHTITRESLTNLRIALNTSHDVNEFLDML